jgi:glycosyltransferase involved in cell wall biosynthesis
LPHDYAITLVLWPAFGWLEPLLWAGKGRNARLIVHDPVPLRRQYGQGLLSRTVARIALRRLETRFICHTDDAAHATMDQLQLKRAPSVALHPVLTIPDIPVVGYRDTAASPVVLVAGQYKPSRDIKLLSDLGPLLKSSGIRAKIVGRGWPPITGWDIDNRFLSEHEFEAEVRSASAIVIPYIKYWQSGVAIQAFEREVPVVGAPTTFLRTLFGDEYNGFAESARDAKAWLSAISRIISEPPDVHLFRKRYQDAVDESWTAQLNDHDS